MPKRNPIFLQWGLATKGEEIKIRLLRCNLMVLGWLSGREVAVVLVLLVIR